MRKNLILSSIFDMEYEKIAPFVESLRTTGSDAHIHLFLSRVSEGSRKKIEALGITTQEIYYLHFRRRRPLLLFWPLWKRVLASQDLAGKCRTARPVFQFFALRHVLNYEYLSEHEREFENVLVTDCRDVTFQRDPFSDNLGPGVHCFLEAEGRLIGNCSSNRSMVNDAFGPEGLAELAGSPVSCAGTVLGDIQSVLAYEKKMVEELCTIKKMTQGNDQGVHNHVVHKPQAFPVFVHDNYSSSVFTAGCERAEDITLNDQDQITRKDGSAYPILHQHDRHHEIYRKVLAKIEGIHQDAAVSG